MKKLPVNTSALLKTLSFSLLLVSFASQAAEPLGDLSMLNQIGNSHTMSWDDDNAAIALLVQSNGNVATLSALLASVELQRQYSQSIQFFMVNPRGLMNRDAVSGEIIWKSAEEMGPAAWPPTQTLLAIYGTSI